ncbi:hypothetical protein ACFQ0M_07640 [Kitasatospora aburaviensis]
MTVTSSRLPEAHTPAPSASGTGTGSATPLTVPPSPAASPEQILDEATRAVSYAAGSPFAWM